MRTKGLYCISSIDLLNDVMRVDGKSVRAYSRGEYGGGMKYNIKITCKQFGKSEGTEHELGMTREAAENYCIYMNKNDGKWASYEVITRAPE